MKRVFSIFTLLIILFTVSSCRFSDDDNIIRYDIGSEPITLDPQAANDRASELILSHVLEGLVTKNQDGEIIGACAKDFSVASDGLTYTFALHEDLVWSNGARLTSDDFLFAFTRIFSPETNAAYKSNFLSIKNASKILNNELPIDNLGVFAPNENTLVIQLEYVDSEFIENLTSVSALPCNREFFESTKGKYGADHKNIIYNNRFCINDWKKNNYVTLRPNSKYRKPSEIKSDGINFYTSESLEKEQRFLEETTDIVALSSSSVKKLDADKFKTIEFSCTTWVLGFNQGKEIFKNQNLRTAFTLCAQGIDVTPDKDVFQSAERILPLSLNSNFESLKLTANRSAFSLYQDALQELKLSKLPTVSVVCPDYYDFKLYLTYLQKSWSEQLGIAVNFEVLSNDDYSTVLQNGSFDIIIMPLTTYTDSPADVLSHFTTLSNFNHLSLADDDFDALITNAIQQRDQRSQNLILYEAEKLLIESAVITPIFHEKEYLGVNIRVEDILISPFGPEINFSSAYKK